VSAGVVEVTGDDGVPATLTARHAVVIAAGSGAAAGRSGLREARCKLHQSSPHHIKVEVKTLDA
jgi:hypothetical protein